MNTIYQPEWCHNFECDYPKCNCLEPPVYSNATDAIGFQDDMQRRKEWETVKGIQDQANRKNRLDLNEPSELAIYNAMQEVEKVGADVRLTKVVTLLSEAKDVLGDYFDERLGESMKTLGTNR